MAKIQLLFVVWSLAISTLSASFYEEVIAPAAQKLDRKLPKGIMESYIKYPELMMQPSIEGDDNLIVFIKGRPSTYTKYTDKLQKLYESYQLTNNQEAENMMDCTSYTTYRPPEDWKHPCRFDPKYEFDWATNYGQCSPDRQFGYEDAEPCVFLSFDRVYNWVPEPYNNDTVPDAIRDDWSPDYITVKCEGTDPVSVDNLGWPTILPKKGASFKYFPNNGHSSWRSPLVAVSIAPAPGILVEVRCTAWAKNMIHRDLLNTGSVKFSLMVS